MAQQGFLGELHHFDGILNGYAPVVKTRALWRAINSYHVEIQLWCQAAIQAEFFLAEEVPFGERREINKAQIDGLFNLVGVWASQHDPRDMGLQNRDLGSRMLVHGVLG